MQKPNCVLVSADAREALARIPSQSINCIITSPPYGALKDYGSPGQIGFGQHRDGEYLTDLRAVLDELYRVALPGAALWVVLDTLNESGKMVPLPWEVVTRAREAGWSLHDLIVWDKGRSLPWSYPNRFRNVCEYILLLGKGKLGQFNLDAVRDAEHLSSYWVRYPERYHPDGKAPTDLWHFPIPTQGSWSKGEIRHFCPFPVGLVARMILVTTKPGDIVLDPFSGTGSVVAVADHLQRYGLGVELNDKFVRDFDRIGYNSLIKQAQAELPQGVPKGRSLRRSIVELRMLKYPKTLYSGLTRGDRMNGSAREAIGAFLIRSSTRVDGRRKVIDSSNLGRIELQILARPGADLTMLREAVAARISVAPLTKFGIEATVEIIPFTEWNEGAFTASLDAGSWHIYRTGKFYQYDARVTPKQLAGALRAEATDTRRKVPSIVSRVKLHLVAPVDD